MNKEEIRVAKTMTLVIGTFIICWTPMAIICMVVANTKDLHYFDHNEGSRIGFMFCSLAAHLNSAIDPIIFAYRIPDARDKIKKILKCGLGN